MPNTLDLVLNGGVVTSKGVENLTSNEMTSGIGVWYKPGDSVRLHKIEGRSLFGHVSGYLVKESGVAITENNPVKGVVAAVYDTGYSHVLAYVGSGVFSAPLGLSGSFALFYSGWINPTDNEMKGIHDNGRWVLYNGRDENIVVNANSGTRLEGMQQPGGLPPTLNLISGAPATYRPTGYTQNVTLSGYYLMGTTDGGVNDGSIGVQGRWIANGIKKGSDYPNGTDGPSSTHSIQGGGSWYLPQNAFDSGLNPPDSQYAYSYSIEVWADTPMSDAYQFIQLQTIEYSGFASSTTPDRRINVKGYFTFIHQNDFQSRYNNQVAPTLTMEYSLNGGVSWISTSPISPTLTDGGAFTIQTDLLGSVNNNQIHIRFSHFNPWGMFRCMTFAAIRDIRIFDGGNLFPNVIEALAYYGYTEVDTNVPVTGGFLESTINYNTSGVNLSGIAGVTVYFPSGAPRNSNATKYYIYRVDVSGTPPQDFTKVGEAQITSSGWVDDFTVPIGNASSTPYGMVRVVDSYYDRDVPPPAFIHINEYKGSHVALSDSYPRRLYYTPPGRRESYPIPYRIESFPMAKHDELRGTISLGDTMLILAIGGVMTIDELPIANQEGILGVESNVRKIDGQPGCVGYRSFVPYSVNGAPRGAWVSRFGVQITTGATVARISDDLDWKATVNIDTLESSILFWDEDRQMLVLHFDQDGDGVNDHMLFFHMAPEHTKGSESRPKITGPHPVKCKGLTTAEVGGIPYIFTANTTDGSVYVEWNGNADASNAYNASGIVPLSVKSGKIYSKDYREWSAFKGLVRHDHWGGTDTMSVIWGYGRDLHHRVGSVTKSVALSGVQADHFFVGRQGDWAQLELSHEGSGLGSITAIQVVTNMAGDIP